MYTVYILLRTHICIAQRKRIQLTLLDGIQIKVKHDNNQEKKRQEKSNEEWRSQSRTVQNRFEKKASNFTTLLFSSRCRYYYCVWAHSLSWVVLPTFLFINRLNLDIPSIATVCIYTHSPSYIHSVYQSKF